MIKEKICIARVDRMGDMLLTLPVIKTLKIQRNNAEIHVIASKTNSKVLKNINYIDKVIVVNSNIHSLFNEIIILRKNYYSSFFNFSPNLKSLLLCLLCKSKKKFSLIFLSRYKKNFSKIFFRFIAFVFFDKNHIIDRLQRLKSNLELHQTKMMFELINKSGFKPLNKKERIEIALPKNKISFKAKKTILIHIPDKWINLFYSEEDLIQLISNLVKKNYLVLLTTDYSTKNKFKKIFRLYKTILNNDLNKISKIKEKVIILDKFNYDSWLNAIYSSDIIITPECGCSHISAACGTLVNIIYDPNNFPEAIIKEYAPWNSKYNKFLFNEENLNSKLIDAI